jgi:hypothetical protein
MTSKEKHQAWLEAHEAESIMTKRVDAGYLPQEVGAELDKLAHNDGAHRLPGRPDERHRRLAAGTSMSTRSP